MVQFQAEISAPFHFHFHDDTFVILLHLLHVYNGDVAYNKISVGATVGDRSHNFLAVVAIPWSRRLRVSFEPRISCQLCFTLVLYVAYYWRIKTMMIKSYLMYIDRYEQYEL